MMIRGLLGLLVLIPALARAAPPEPVLRARIAVPIETFDWTYSASIGDTPVIVNIMEGLFAYDEQRAVRPQLAESFTMSDDARHFVFKLRPGVKWSDGRALAASDFVDSWKRLMDPLSGAIFAYYLANIAGAEDFIRGVNKDFASVGVKAIDARTLAVDLARPCRFFAQMLTLWVTFPVRLDLIAKNGLQHWTDPDKIAVLGPFVPTFVEKDKRYSLRPNPLYHGARETVGVDVEVIADDAAALRQFTEHSLDFLVNPVRSAAADPALWASPAHHSVPLLRTRFLAFNTSRYPLSLLKVRQAIAMAVDFSQASQITHRDSAPAPSFVPTLLFPEGKGLALPYDPLKAKAVLAETGIDTATLPPIDLIGIGDDEMALVIANVQDQLRRNLGLKVNGLPSPVAEYRNHTNVGDGGVYLMSWTGDYLEPDAFLSVFLSGANRKEVRWSNAKYDELVRQGASLDAGPGRSDLYARALTLLERDEAVVAPLYTPNTEYLLAPGVSGATVDLFGGVRFRALKLARPRS